MTAVRVTKAFTVNMGPGTYETYRVEYSADLEVRETFTEDGAVHDNAYAEAFERANHVVDAAAYADLTEAAATTEMRNTFILTWIDNRKDENYAH